VRTLSGYESKLSSASVSRDVNYIITTSFDRTFRLWQKKDKAAEENEHAIVENAVVENADAPMTES